MCCNIPTLVSWYGSSIEEALWVDERDFQLKYPEFAYESPNLTVEITPSSESTEERRSKGRVLEQEIHTKKKKQAENQVFKVAAENEEVGLAAKEENEATRVSNTAATPPFIDPQDCSTSGKLGKSVGLEDKASSQGVGIDKAQPSYGPNHAIRPARIKSAPAWAADFM
ncbi:hypothetical protein OROGR_011834 [Orobanche gracilis]